MSFQQNVKFRNTKIINETDCIFLKTRNLASAFKEMKKSVHTVAKLRTVKVCANLTRPPGNLALGKNDIINRIDAMRVPKTMISILD